MDKLTVSAGKNALVVGLFIYLSATALYPFSMGYSSLAWLLLGANFFGIILIVMGVAWVIDGFMGEKKSNEYEDYGEENPDSKEDSSE